MHVAVFGLGYVGCVTASCLARAGHTVVGVDVSADKVSMVNDGQSPIIEPGLAELIAQVVADGRLSATTDACEAMATSDVALICVGTPSNGHGEQDLTALSHVAADIGRACADRTRPLTVVLRSTVLPGTTGRVLNRLLMEGAQHSKATIRIAMNPEFMREGSAVDDFQHPPFIVVGSDDPLAVEVVRTLYAEVDGTFIATSVQTAEMVKCVCNAFHALKIVFGNEVADLCGALGADAQEVMNIVCEDKKLNISRAYLTPGFAYGGSCLPKDLRALLSVGRINDIPVPLLAGVVESNIKLIQRGVQAVLDTKKRKVGLVGLAFKPTTDDLRESPMVTLAETLIGKGCDLKIYDPTIVLASLKGANKRYIETEIPHISSLLCDNVDCLLQHADVLVFATTGKEALKVMAAAGDHHTIIDLTHGALAKQLARTPRLIPSKV